MSKQSSKSKSGAATAEATFEDMLSRPRGRSDDAQVKVDGLLLGELVDGGEVGLRVRFCHQGVTHEYAAVSTAALDGDQAQPVVLAFIKGRPEQPVILGQLHPDAVVRPGNGRLTLEAEDELTLRCGEASLTLTKAGKVTVKGKTLTSRADGVHRIQGGSVQIN